ncbi:hypothetical protein QAD02_007005 [Eretmocerus hayati]|uniref:Uncharacterized protein n=1 Tax=Eretmocerus hayati TaxID=131215 RepID=A0ACC2N3R2_9HYME|nr:hypothetical protein QAD02_007005 [Eretmocerus hayati]
MPHKFETGIRGSKDDERIIGGESANIQDYPYQVSMRWTYGVPKPTHFCGGAIVSKNHIVTAAHCVEDKMSPSSLKYMKIYAGTSRSDTVGQGNVYNVKKITIHPSYRGSSNTYLNDIAIITVNEPIVFNEYQQKVQLPSKDVQTGVEAVITGWGLTHPSYNQLAKQLQKTSSRLVASSQCQRKFPLALRNIQVCAVQKRGVGVCSGDSGGPLVSNGTLVGIASFVIECGKGYPDVYTNVFPHSEFLKSTIF